MTTDRDTPSRSGDDHDAAPLAVIRFQADDGRIIHADERAWRIIGVSDENTELRAHITGNIERMVPLAQQPAFEAVLSDAARGRPQEFDTKITRPDGSVVELACWLTSEPEGEAGAPKGCLRLAIVDVTQKRRRARDERRRDRVGYLSSEYDIVFLIEGRERCARCLRFAHDGADALPQGLRMVLDDVATYLADHLAAPQERKALSSFVAAAAHPLAADEAGHRRLVFAARAEQPGARREAVIIAAEGGDAFLCSRPILGAEEDAPSLHPVGDAWDDEAVIVTVRAPDERQRLVYSNAAAQLLFGKDVRQMPHASPERLLARAGFAPEAARALEENGSTGALKSPQGTAYRFRLDSMPGTPTLRVLRALPATSTAPAGAPRVTVRTFGYFDVFIDGKPIAFRSEKAKELLALLVDRRGGFVSSADAIAVLWEHEPLSERSRTRYRKVALRLKNTLAAYGAEGIVESERGRRRIVPSRVRCDLFDYLDHAPGSEDSFRGAYLTNYSWAEVTLSELVYA